MTTFRIDASRLPDGRNTFYARAIEFAGHRARDQLTLDLDNTPPAVPVNLQIAARGEDAATLTWNPGPEPPAEVASCVTAACSQPRGTVGRCAC